MKTVVNKSNVAHFWANKVQDNARVSNGNFYFDGDTIYSYGRHFPIATHYKGIVLFTLNSYSNTTAKHISVTRSACSHLEKIYCLNPYSAACGNHTSNIEYWLKSIEGEKTKTLAARKPEIYIGNIEWIVRQLNTYVTFFSLKLTKEQKALLVIKDKAAYLSEAKERAAKQEKQDAAKMKEGKKVYTGMQAAWHSYNETEHNKGLSSKQKTAANFYFNAIGGYNANDTNLRTNGNEVETSKGIKMPIDVAKRYYSFYTRIVKAGGCTGNCNYKMMEYDVKEATEKALIVGCHNIPVTEINAIAAKLNWA